MFCQDRLAKTLGQVSGVFVFIDLVGLFSLPDLLFACLSFLARCVLCCLLVDEVGEFQPLRYIEIFRALL